MPSRRSFMHGFAATSICLLFGSDYARARPAHVRRHLAVADCAPLPLAPLAEQPIGAAMARIGRSSLNTPYTAGLLDRSREEQLVTDVGHVDCVTFIENTLALARSRRHFPSACGGYQHELRRIRYRNGILNGYTSRLHYFTDWLDDNQRKDILRDVTQHLGGIAFHKKINFMTTHRYAYPQLADAQLCEQIRVVEAHLSTQSRSHVPQWRVAEVQETLEEGDIIALTTSRPGLDVAHMGIAVHEAGTIKLLHASKVHGRVVTTPESLAEHVMKSRMFSGIIVARALEPQEYYGDRGR